MRTRSVFLSLLLIGILASVAPAQTTLDVDLGWQGIFRARHWGPVFVTLSDSKPRNAIIEVYTGHDEVHGMYVRQLVPLNAAPVTYAIYVPLQNWGPDLSVTIRDAGSFRRLANWNLQESGSDIHFEPVENLIGVTGRSGAERLIGLQFQGTDIKTPWVNPLFLPNSSRGYDAFNVLFLNQPDLSRIPVEQQEAMLDWVRAGGRIICWMGEEAIPGSGPLLEALPALIGENIAIQLSDAALGNAGLASRFRTLKGRSLMGAVGAEEIPLLSRSASAWRRKLGLGSITLLPVDVSTLMFDSPLHGQAFWEPILGRSVDFTKQEATPPTDPNLVAFQTMQSNSGARLADAANQAMNILGDVPGAGDFGISYVMVVLLGMMLLVGPIDWIILKKLGRQPWTWMTTGGWIALITLGAVYIGYFFRSGDLHYRTLRLIDQADNLTVSTIDVAGIYSPRTAQYTLNAPATGWWEPLSSGMWGYSSSRLVTDLHFHQDYQGNHPDPMLIRVWNMRFLTSQSLAPGSPYLQTNVRREMREGRDHLVGTVTNVSTVPLKGLCYRLGSRRGIVSGAQTIAPGQTLTIDAPIGRERQPDSNADRPYSGYVRPPHVGPEAYFDLAIDRSIQIDRLLESNQPYVCLYAEIDNPTPQVTLTPPAAIEKHQQFIRAILPLETGDK